MTDAFPPRLVELLNPRTGVVALAATHLESGRTWRHNEHLRLPSASLTKLPILASFWETVEAGRLDPMERVNVSAEPSMWLSPLPVPLKLSMLRA